MAKWSPPQFTYHRYADGTLVAVDSNGEPLACQPKLATKSVDIADPSSGEGGPSRTATVVVDQWGNRVGEYQIPPYKIQICSRHDEDGYTENIGVAVDADGQPVTLVPNMEVAGRAGNDIDVTMPDGSTATFDAYDGPQDVFIHYSKSHSHEEGGTPTVETIVVDADGVPLPVQPFINYYDLAQAKPTGQVWWSDGPVLKPPVHEFPEFSVHLQYPSAALEGHASASPVPIAVGADGKPLAIQPDWQVDPSDPSNVQAVMPGGQLRDAPSYEFPRFQVHLEYPADSYRGAAAPVPHPIAVDDDGVPLPIQPMLSVDPTDHNKITATLAGQSVEEVPKYEMPKDFYIHVESSDLGEHGAASHVAVAVDASGNPLPVQPHLVVDPTDPTKVTAYFPDGTTSTPPSLYPPPGEPPDEWPPEVWPPESGTDETVELDDTVEFPEEGSTVPPEDLEPVEGLDTAVEPDPTATPPDDVEAAQPGFVTAEGPDDAAEPEATATPPDDVQAAAPEMEQTSAPLGDTFDPGDRYSGVAMTEGEVALDDDFNQRGTVDDLVTAGLDEPITAESRVAEEALEEVADDTTTLAEVSEIEGLVTAGLEPEFKVEEAEFKVEEPVLDDAVPELKWGDESIEEASSLPLPLPSPTIAPEVGEGRGEPIEMTDVRRAEPIEEAVIEPIEILVEPIDTAAIREVSPIGEPDESDRLASLDDEDEEEEQAQP